MSKLFKNGFIYLVLMLLIFSSISIESASAAEVVDYEEGVTNLNNTLENSAVVGDTLKKPEKGWKRYDNSHDFIKYNGDWITQDSNVYYKKSINISTYRNLNNTVSFSFLGSKIRLISTLENTFLDEIKITIDEKEFVFSQNSALRKQQVISFQNTELDYGHHTVEIKKTKNGRYYHDFDIDAIDVDGSLISENDVPNVETISLDRDVLELLESSQDKLIATVTPDTAKVIWSSSDESIATVDQDGNVTALREGEVIITAKIEGTDITATSTVIVKKPSNESSNAILSITLVNGITKEYDVTNKVLNDYLKWFDSAQGTSTFKFSKTISPYKKVTEYIVHDKIASFEVREY
ncbi:Ig-like domain-containing protein [Lysinibacillus xylanilyticus]|uniref:Ig-like domain-containing protein n=1 Tax=Lysinibacillus xylanilyticus TaxID=582475 RepID=UPI0037FBAC72